MNPFIVTGAASGIGLANVLRLCDEGALLALADLDACKLEAATSWPSERVLIVRTDVSVQADADALIAAAVTPSGRIDGSLSASIGHPKLG